MRTLVLVVLLAGMVPRSGGAHPLTPALLELHEHAGGRVEVTWTTSALVVPDAPLRPVLPARCATRAPPAEERRGERVVTRWEVDCGAPGLVGETLAAEGLGPARTQVLVRVTLADGRLVQGVLRAAAPGLVVPARPGRLQVVRDYVRLGIEHILTGADHLLFVFGLLLLAPAPRAVVWTVTAFTVGHSITLSLVVLGAVTVPAGPAELLIALTVLALAVELARPPGTPSRVRRWPWGMALAFGLLHGLGFAGALRETGLPMGDIPLALFAFNLGIEVGQLAFVVAILAGAFGLRRVRWPGWARAVPVYTMGSLAAFWCFGRAASLFS